MLRVLYMQNLKKYIAVLLLLMQSWGKVVHLPQQQGPLFEISYIVLFSVMALKFQVLN